ncbi:hypothetical protein FRC15_007627, partial [Serendipita sp. 397]
NENGKERDLEVHRRYSTFPDKCSQTLGDKCGFCTHDRDGVVDVEAEVAAGGTGAGTAYWNLRENAYRILSLLEKQKRESGGGLILDFTIAGGEENRAFMDERRVESVPV